MFWFRVMDDEGEPTGQVGMVSGDDTAAVYWALDEFCDPWRVELAHVSQGGFCIRRPDMDVEADELDDDEDLEVSGTMPYPNDEDSDWFKPDWSNVPYAGLNQSLRDAAPWA